VKLSLICLGFNSSSVGIAFSAGSLLDEVEARSGVALDNQREGNERIAIGVTVDVDDSRYQQQVAGV